MGDDIKIRDIYEDIEKPALWADLDRRIKDLESNQSSFGNITAKNINSGIASPVFKSGEKGWILKENGDAEFNNGVFRGALAAATIDIGGSDTTSFHVDINGNIWSGNALFASAPFKVSNAGVLTASGATITGTITGSSLAIPDNVTANSFHVDTSGNAWWGSILIGDAVAKVLNTGAGTFSNITITGGSVAGGTITSASIAGSQLQNATITATQIANATVTATQIANATITATQIANATITTTQISGTAAITGAQIASATIAAANIANATITATQIANATITTTQISGTAGITGGQIASATISGGNIGSATITATNIANATITTTQISGTAGITGTQIANNTITATQITNATITATQIANGAITPILTTMPVFVLSTGTFTSNSPTAVKVAWTGCKVVYNGTESTITNDNTASTYIIWNSASPTVFSGSSTVPTTNTVFLVGINSTGTYSSVWDMPQVNGAQIQANTITAGQIANATITGTQIALATIAAGNITNATITATQIANGTITSTEIANATIVATNISGTANITGSQLSSTAGIVGGQIANTTITGGNLVNNTVTVGKCSIPTHFITATWTDDTPNTASVTWAGAKVDYNGTTYSIDNGNTDKKYIWWDFTLSTTTFQVADALPTLSDGDVLVAYNNAGVHRLLWNATDVDGSQIQLAAITGSNIANTTITGGNLVNNTITATQIANATITGTQIANTTITGGLIANNTITAGKVSLPSHFVSGTFTDNSPIAGKVAWSSTTLDYNGTTYAIDAGNTADKYIWWDFSLSTTTFQTSATLPTLANADCLVGLNNTGVYQSVWNSTGTNGSIIENATIVGGSIANTTITGANLVNNTITATQIANATITTTQISGTAGITGSQIAATTIAASNITNATITATQIANGAITPVLTTIPVFVLSAGTFTNNSPTATKVAWANAKVTYNGTQSSITNNNTDAVYIIWDSASPTVFSGSATVPTSNTVFLVGVNSAGTYSSIWDMPQVNGLQIQANTITAGQITNATITATQIANNTITASQIANNTITATQIANNTITATQIANTTITASQIAALTITAAEIANLTITSGKINDVSVDKLTTGSITSKAITLAVAAGTGDTYIAAGKRDFINSTTLGGSTTQFDITNTSGTTYRYTYDGTGTDPLISTSTMQIGTIAVIAAQNFAAGNNGTFTITLVGTNYFEVTNAVGVAENNKTIGTGSIVVHDPGFILGIDDSDSDKAKLYIGNATNYFNWTGSIVDIAGKIAATSGTIGGFTIGETDLTAQGISLGSGGIAQMTTFQTGASGNRINLNSSTFQAYDANDNNDFTISVGGTAPFINIDMRQNSPGIDIDYVTNSSGRANMALVISDDVQTDVAPGSTDSVIARIERTANSTATKTMVQFEQLAGTGTVFDLRQHSTAGVAAARIYQTDLDKTSLFIWSATNTTEANIGTVEINAPTTGMVGIYIVPAANVAHMRLYAGSAPASPVDGDFWYDGTNLKIRVGGTTKTIAFTA